MSEADQQLRKKENMKTVFNQIDLDNLVFQKRERKQVGQQTQMPVPVIKKAQVSKPKSTPKVQKVPTERPQNEEPQYRQPVVMESESSEFDPKERSKKLGGKKFRRTHPKFRENDSSDEEEYKKHLILKRVNKIFKKSYEQKQVLHTGSEQDILVRNLFKNLYEKIFQEIPIPSSDLKIINENSTEEIQGDNEKRILPEECTDMETRRNLKLLGMLKPILIVISDTFNLDFLVEKVGSFDVILMDPPWRIKGGQQNDSSFMFTNSKFQLDYNTMSNQEIMDIKIEKLSKKGFLFLWILNTQITIASEMVNKWGYEIVDQIVWVKLNAQGNNIYLSTGYYFMHSYEMCLVGYKCPQGDHVEYHSKVSNNIIFSPVRNKSQKPLELYEIIELMMPGAKRLEIFARNHNLRHGWFSIGNQLGETYQKWHIQINCNSCPTSLQPGIARFKSKRIANFDICQKCYEEKIQLGEYTENDFFQLANKADEEVLHQYHQCNVCEQEPIWGTRFECVTCENYDLCEACFDHTLTQENQQHKDHDFRAIELPIFAQGIPCHDAKCNSCFQKPILGVQFTCKQCSNYNLCQNCFFARNSAELSGQRHKPDHRMEPIYEPQNQQKKQYKCQGCEIEVSGELFWILFLRLMPCTKEG
ncbi:hypothetical protein pb186bvf_015405 [Paramecium bursaria]